LFLPPICTRLSAFRFCQPHQRVVLAQSVLCNYSRNI
jgi:hypothetical protein